MKKHIILFVVILCLSCGYVFAEDEGGADNFDRAVSSQKFLLEKLDRLESYMAKVAQNKELKPDFRGKIAHVFTLLRSELVREQMQDAIPVYESKMLFDSLEKTDEVIAALQKVMSAMNKFHENDLPEIGDHEVGKPLTYKELTVYPVYRKGGSDSEAEEITDFLPLDAVLKSRGAIISNELLANEFKIENKTSNSLYLMAGEIIYSGNSESILDRDYIIAPHSSPKLRVMNSYRNYESREVPECGMLAQANVRFVANHARAEEFVIKTIENNCFRMDVPKKDGYRALICDKTVNEYTDKHVDGMKARLLSDEKVVGLLLVRYDEIIACDIYKTHEMYKMFEHSLLKAYALDAISTPPPGCLSKNVTPLKERIEKLFDIKNHHMIRCEIRRAGLPLLGVYVKNEDLRYNINYLKGRLVRCEILNEVALFGVFNNPNKPGFPAPVDFEPDEDEIPDAGDEFAWSKLQPDADRRNIRNRNTDELVSKYAELTRRYFRYISREERRAQKNAEE